MFCCRNTIVHLLFRDAEPSRLGKVRAAHLPQEYRLAQFVSNISHPHYSWTDKRPACDWEYVRCDSDYRVSVIAFANPPFSGGPAGLAGNLLWRYMPDTTLNCTTAFQRLLTGTLPIAYLPASLINLSIARGKHFGSVDLTMLPPEIQDLRIQENQFSGTLDLTSLPTSLGYLSLSNNRFVGPVDFSKLPDSIKHIELRGNQVYATSSVPSLVDFRF